ncbi:hypothetical protein PF001_g16994 [Phytophthora fragariae]|uniref:Uncharacterized protein n=1 Tax=Phytophthora fragariae TaxID=53985 RepID=A0A6A4CVY8_9STRA|nr:hypothetical protein PF003_g16999 [Phytophthora fragariae]KAE9296151.1 hypothetical protein PF001_g16994 [Phytophthora fragariae]
MASEEDSDVLLLLADAFVRYGSDINFLNATSLTKSSFRQLLRRFASYYYIPRARSRGRPLKLRYHHQEELAKLVEAREPLLKHTFGFIDGKNFKVQQPSNADLQNAIRMYCVV